MFGFGGNWKGEQTVVGFLRWLFFFIVKIVERTEKVVEVVNLDFGVLNRFSVHIMIGLVKISIAIT